MLVDHRRIYLQIFEPKGAVYSTKYTAPDDDSRRISSTAERQSSSSSSPPRPKQERKSGLSNPTILLPILGGGVIAAVIVALIAGGIIHLPGGGGGGGGKGANVSLPSQTTSPPPAAINHSPTAVSTLTTKVNTPVNITLEGSDPDGNALSAAIVTPPIHGKSSPIFGNIPIIDAHHVSVHTVTYTPVLNFTGHDFFTFKVNDGKRDSSNTGTMNIRVNGTNPDLLACAENAVRIFGGAGSVTPNLSC
jgi:hypothetical protein